MSKLKDSYLAFIVKLTSNGSSKQCLMTFRHLNKTISLHDIKTHKQLYPSNQLDIFNKKITVEELTISKTIQLLINQNCKAQILIIAYADEYTKSLLHQKKDQNQRILFFIKPGFIQNKKLGEVLSSIQSQFHIKRFKMFKLTKQNLQKYIVNQKMLNSQNDKNNILYLSSGPCFGFQISGDNYLLAKIKKIVGLQSPSEAKKIEKLSLRAKYGQNIIQNCCHYSKNTKSAHEQIEFIFSNQVKECMPLLSNSSLVLIKPHIVIDKNFGKLITLLLQKEVSINSMRFQYINVEVLKKYMDLYKFLPQYQQNLIHFQQEKSVLMEITVKKSNNSFELFKTICGPYDPSYAKKISPQSIRGVFGIDRLKNAVHYTQLIQDAQTQIKLLFQL